MGRKERGPKSFAEESKGRGASGVLGRVGTRREIIGCVWKCAWGGNKGPKRVSAGRGGLGRVCRIEIGGEGFFDYELGRRPLLVTCTSFFLN